VRFCQEAAEGAGSGSECLVPPSVVRHGMRRNQVSAPDSGAAVAASEAACSGTQPAPEGFTTPAVKPKRGSRLAGMSTGKPQATSSRIALEERLQQAAAAAGGEGQVAQVPPVTPARTAPHHSSKALQLKPADQVEAVGSRSTSVADRSSTASRSSSSSTADASCGLLVLDAQLQALPWEALPGLQQHDMYR
jgi:hypothetical protein